MVHMTVFELLADPTRRAIVASLRRGERPVNDIVEAVAIHQSGVSRHLGILHEHGFVDVRPEGPQRFYSLRPEPFRELELWLDDYRAVWEARLDRFAVALAQKQRTRARTTTGKKKP